MRIDIWSDVVCPWCYIGKRRLETALGTFDHADDVEVVWHSYMLDPGAPSEPTEPTSVMLARKYGQTPEGARQMQDQVEAVAAEEGLVYRLSETLHLNTLDAHRLIHLALHDGGPELQGRVKEALLAAYFTEARNVADPAELRAVAVEAGLDAAAIDRVLAGTEHTDDVWADIEKAQAFGATGVPFFVIDNKYGVSGAQPAEAFSQVLERAWSESHPVIEVLAGTAGQGDACGPDGCAV
ncbi:DsbA family oxidoreductase [Nocardioides currus]|uniref:Disulfide bond formation protein DsbA n=1 Tax=Nocardioides currus TaxID=2133958 RepID=A0A2R7YWS3_9ACTN|nr:DsbA family oxidoreductase [Nocardioides currus]PUA80850.1 disulfide bond formation protein DsbA [Nocardioides currus]